MSTTIFCGYELHPAANLFPMFGETELQELAADIKTHGQLHPIILHEGKILDGRNRALACHQLGIDPMTQEWTGTGSPIDYVLSTNLHRRHLSHTQRVCIAVELVALFEAEAKERQRMAVVNRHAEERGDVVAPKSEQLGRSAEKAAKAMDVGKTAVYEARKLEDEAPETFEAMKRGEMALQDARRRTRSISDVDKELDAHPDPVSGPLKTDPSMGECTNDSNAFFGLKRYWRQANKQDRKDFRKWIETQP